MKRIRILFFASIWVLLPPWLQVAPADGGILCGEEPVQEPVSLPISPSFATPLIGECPLFPTCPGTGVRPYWGQEAVSASLMKDELTRLHLPVGSAHVAVVDTGFDIAGNRSHLAQPDLFKAFLVDSSDGKTPTIATPDTDGTRAGPHGTWTTTLVGGAGDIGLSPGAQVTMYSLNSESVQSSALDFAVRKACDDGNEVINLSFGGIEEEQNGNSAWDSKLISHLEEKGCLVVQSAGNDAVQQQKKDRLDSPILRVSATASASLPSSSAFFSSTGETGAPGEFVLTFNDSKNTDVHGFQRCGTDTVTSLEPGTSFSAPITSGIASNVVGVLKTSASYGSLQPKDKIRLVKRIIEASGFDHEVNGYRAVMIAEGWMKFFEGRKSPSVSSVADLQGKVLHSVTGEICRSPAPKCQKSDCKTRSSCVQDELKFDLLCDSRDSATDLDLIQSAEKGDELELAVRALDHLHSVNPSEAQRQALLLEQDAQNEVALANKSPADSNRRLLYLESVEQLTGKSPAEVSRLVSEREKYLLANIQDGSFEETEPMFRWLLRRLRQKYGLSKEFFDILMSTHLSADRVKFLLNEVMSWGNDSIWEPGNTAVEKLKLWTPDGAQDAKMQFLNDLLVFFEHQNDPAPFRNVTGWFSGGPMTLATDDKPIQVLQKVAGAQDFRPELFPDVVQALKGLSNAGMLSDVIMDDKPTTPRTAILSILQSSRQTPESLSRSFQNAIFAGVPDLKPTAQKIGNARPPDPEFALSTIEKNMTALNPAVNQHTKAAAGEAFVEVLRVVVNADSKDARGSNQDMTWRKEDVLSKMFSNPAWVDGIETFWNDKGNSAESKQIFQSPEETRKLNALILQALDIAQVDSPGLARLKANFSQ